MNGAKKDNVTSLSEEKYAALSEQNGWSLAFAEGLVSGQTERRRGNPPSSYLIVGADDYALGFRAGYFQRRNPDNRPGLSDGKPDVKNNEKIGAERIA